MFVGHNGRRSGTRGGRDQFSWENVKADKKTRENYIGHSLHTSAVPSFNDPKPNPMWYLKGDGADEQEEAANELQRLKQLEQEMMLEALGLKPRGSTSASAAAAAATKRPLKPHELGDVLKRGQNTASAAEPGDDNASAAAGLGAKSGSGASLGAMGAFGVPEAIEGVDLPDEHWQRVHEQRRRERDQKAPVDAPQRRREESPRRRRQKSKKRHEHKKRSKKRRSSSSSSSSSSDSSDSDPRRRRRRHDSDSDDSGGGRRRRRHDSDSERSRSRSRSPRRR